MLYAGDEKYSLQKRKRRHSRIQHLPKLACAASLQPSRDLLVGNPKRLKGPTGVEYRYLARVHFARGGSRHQTLKLRSPQPSTSTPDCLRRQHELKPHTQMPPARGPGLFSDPASRWRSAGCRYPRPQLGTWSAPQSLAASASNGGVPSNSGSKE
ncbi:hypothetical protein HIM_06423 [Hirsutella minnesotensis 3608]|uniref:Uncharacterized protein n=1 Tax=Hirsutella minnesotensis 3608 TaxID=1043627 RepID=A0A0F7ZZG7_9HYPO|nr:hypothetical protein HIM_06423 [Hirsutella minnesotensis 3608]